MHQPQIILNYFPELTSKQAEQFSRLKDLYSDWNSKINVISRKDIDNLYVNHVLHSLGIAKVIQFKKGTKVLDVGTGGGFPGIPLAILFPETRFHLVDSIGKKITVVNEIAKALELKNVVAEKMRIENSPLSIGRGAGGEVRSEVGGEVDSLSSRSEVDFIVSRAVTTLSEFYQWTRPLIKKDGFNDLHNGILCLKGGDLAEEIKALKKPVMIFDLKDYFKEDFFETKKVVYIG